MTAHNAVADDRPEPAAPRLAALVGRTAEVAAVRAALKQAADGRARLVLVEGEAGIGKSRILHAALTESSNGTATAVLRGSGHPLEGERPFGLVADALGPSWKEIEAVLDRARSERGGSAESSPELRHRVLESIVAAVEHHASAGPVVVALDDLHWADASSLLAVDQLVRRLADRPVAVVAALRPAPRSAALDRLLHTTDPAVIDRVAVGPLDSAAVSDLVSDLLGTPPGPTLLTQLTGASGNPFFIEELVRALDSDGIIAVTGGHADVTASPHVHSLELTILRRIGFLSASSLEVLRMASVLGSRFTLDDLSLLLDRPASNLLEPLDEPLRNGVLQADGPRLAFRHDLVRDALYHDLPEALRRALHLQAGRILAAVGRPAAEAAHHFATGATPGDQEAIAWLRRAAADAMAYAPNVAADLLELAAALATDESRDTRDEILVDLATARLWAGQVPEGRELLEQLVDRPHAYSVDGLARLGLIQTLIVGGRAADAIHHCEALELATSVTAPQRARALTDAAMARLMSGDLAGAEADARRALEAGQQLDDDPAVCGALCALSWVDNLQGRTEQALAVGRQAVELAESSTEPETRRRYPHSYLAIVLMADDQLDEGARMFDTGRRVAEGLGDIWPLNIHHFGAALAAFYAGRIDDARAELTTAASVAEETGTRIFVTWTHALGAMLDIHSDDLRAAGAALDAGQAEAEASGAGMGLDWLFWTRARWHEAQGEHAAAVEVLGSAWDLAETLGLIAQRRLIGPDLVRAALAAGDHDRAAAATAAMVEAAAQCAAPSAQGGALRCRGHLEDDPDLLVEAARAQRAGPRRLELAATCEEAGLALFRADRPDEARALLAEAHDLYGECGAPRDRRRVEAGLRDLGISSGAKGRRQRPTVGWDALTRTELKVTRLAAEGLTNPEIGERLFISRRTVETHLSHVFTKLDLSSRVELAAVVARRDPG